MPRGPLSSWPLGLMGMFHYHVGMNRSGSGGLQMVGLRLRRVLAPGEGGSGTGGVQMIGLRVRREYARAESDYMTYWYSRMFSLTVADRSDVAWLRQFSSGLQKARDEDGMAVERVDVVDYIRYYNSSTTTTQLLSPIIPQEYDLWTGLPPRAPNRTQLLPLPLSSFAVASSAAQLLALLQEAWTGGPRAVLLPANLTLQPWPQGGAALSYNVTLVGPVAGPPVWLFASGQQLARSVVAAAPVQLQLLRLRLVGWSPALPVLGADDTKVVGPQIGSSLDVTAGLRQWKNRCSSSGSAAAPSSTTLLSYELYGCTLEVPQASLDALRYYTALLATCADMSSATASCGLQRLLALPAGVLLQWAVKMDGQVALSAANASNSASSLFFTAATLGGGLLVNSTVVGPSDRLAPAAPATGGTTEAAASGDEVPCGAASLLRELSSLLASQLGTSAAPPGHTSSTSTAAVVGGAVGGAVGVALCVAAVAMLALRSRRRRHKSKLRKQVDPVQALLGNPDTLTSVDMELGPSPVAGPLAAAGAGAGDEPQTGEALPWEPGCDFHLTFSTSQVGGQKGRRTMMDDLDPASGPPGGAAIPLDDAVPWEVVKSEMALMIASFQVAVVQATTPKAAATPSRAHKELGRGAFGVVVLGEWCGLPAAVKLVLLPLSEKSKGHRERLAREVALTVTLRHPHIVPTYAFTLNAIRADNAAALTSLQEEGPEQGDDSDSSVVAMQLRLVMEYCDGGTLKDALKAGMFGVPLGRPAQAGQATTPDARCIVDAELLSAAARGGGGASDGAELAPPTAAAAMSEVLGGGLDSTDASTLETAAAAAEPSVLSSAGVSHAPAAGSLPAAAAMGGASSSPRWADFTAVHNLPLALVTALDVLSGLEYLHNFGVVHGDLTEGNILLKTVRPVLPKLPPGPTAGATPMTHSASGTALTAGASRTGHHGGLTGAVVAPQLLTDTVSSSPTPMLLPALLCYGSSDASAAGAVMASGSMATTHLTATGGDGAGGGVAFLASSGAVGGTGQLARLSALAGIRPVGTASGAAEAAERLLRHSFKIADFGLSVQMKSPEQTHASNMAQGTPYYMAPEVVASGRQCTAADCYSFGVVLWLLLHGVTLADVRPLLPYHAYMPVAPDLLRHISSALPAGAHDILQACLQLQATERPTASELRRQVERLLQEVVGPELSRMLLGAERVEVAPSHQHQ
ncbi:putative serine/threonine-protein kinase [Tetrabaena socialis]|uniref:Putative serine/threonine-protein kinase n=1 Tax=Tetrabaena socialis TaxID=47790 RepID=A0A2J8AJB5_9CHLO|nr:putative serine/threonine-protein kinase [Tetrabaena socialis]|eukprot:PNH12604.1 putative serine/threonine-protein kinase [Tetrabaena socialis]